MIVKSCILLKKEQPHFNHLFFLQFIANEKDVWDQKTFVLAPSELFSLYLELIKPF